MIRYKTDGEIYLLRLIPQSYSIFYPYLFVETCPPFLKPIADSIYVPPDWAILVTQKSASVLYARFQTLLTFVCLPHPRSAWLTFNHTGCWLPGFNLSVIIFWCFHILLSVWSGDTCTFLPEVFMVATGCSYLCGRWLLLIPESSRTTVLFCTS